MKNAFEGTCIEDNGTYEIMYNVPPMFTCLGSPPLEGILVVCLDKEYGIPPTKGVEGAI